MLILFLEQHPFYVEGLPSRNSFNIIDDNIFVIYIDEYDRQKEILNVLIKSISTGKEYYTQRRFLKEIK